MAQSWIVTLHPSVHYKLQTEYQDARASIISIETLAQKFIQQKPVIPDKSLDIKFEWRGAIERYIECLKSHKVSPKEFQKVAHSFPSFKKDFYVKVAEVYAAHEESGGMKSRRQDPEGYVDRDKIMVLAHQLSPVQEEFLEHLSTFAEVKKISTLSSALKPSPLTVWEAPTQESEINSIAQEIGKLIKKKTPLSSIYIFSGDLERQKSDFKVIFNREHIPYSFWNDVRDTVECVSIFPFEPNTVVFGEMGAVFISGASYVAKDAFLMTEDERSYFNEKLGKNVFKTQAETKEETKELLSFLISHSKKLYVSYTHHLTVSFKEFLEEHKNYSFKKLAFQSELAERVPQVILKSLKPLSLLVLKQKKEEILPQSYSVRALTQYERCPYGFLLKECLHLEPEKKITSELSYAEEGELVHTILFRYFTKPSSLEKCCEEAYAVISDKFKKEILYPDRLRIEKGLSHFLKAEKEWQTKSRFTPTFFERPFDKFPLSWKGKTIYLRGKIDRIDIDEKTKEFKVIDYKTGSHIPKSFQLQLYAMAMETLFLKGYHVAEGVFYMLKNSEMKKGFECPTLSEWQLEKEKTVEKIFELVHQIESFSFPATPHTCYDSCETKNVCEHTENI